MAYNVKDWGFIEPGATIFVGYAWSDGGSRGAQYAQGMPEDADSVLSVNDHTIGYGRDSRFWYGFQMKNGGPNGTRFGLDGGGLS
ncbi:MAG TPA: hypothetical protein VFK69_14800 [Candidatus Eisenbacteria bacterium]|nr:hypothetical protein [Candidatus Eisenbacteria bacterium]